MKNIRHMTLGEYKENIVPKIVELKKILRKKYLISAEFYGLRHLTKSEYLDYHVEKARSREHFEEAWTREYYAKNWGSAKMKNEPIPTELHDRYKEIFNELSPLFLDHTKAEISKIHKDHKAEVRRALENVYVEDLKEGVITFEELEAICDSVGVRVPKRVYELKDYIAAGMYKREFVKANGEFLQAIRTFLLPYRERLEALKRDQIMGWVEQFEKESTTSLYNYWSVQKKSDDIYTELSRFFTPNGMNRSTGFDKRLKTVCDYYADSYIGMFIGRLEGKVNLVNLNWGVPKIEFTNKGRFKGGQLNVNFKLTYDNGEVITGDSKVIVAGGYIQCLHQRYLFHFWHNGNNVSMEQMDQLK